MTYPTQRMSSTPPSTDVSIVVGGQSIAGWERVRISRGCERIPSDFELEVTEHFPGQPTDIIVQPGAPCTVMIGKEPIITGYVDRYAAQVSPSTHQITISGRSKCCDLVDNSAKVENSQIGLCTPMTLAQALAQPFGITVSGEASSPQLPYFNVTLGQTPFEIIEQISRYAARIFYDDTSGNLVLEKLGTLQHASGFAEGVNTQQWNIIYSMDDRHSEYTALLFSTQNLTELGDAGNQLGVALDPGVPRYRPLIIVSEQFINGQSLALQRAQWEAQRRRGRSQQLNLTCDSWFDSAGTLWTPNTLAPITFPSLKLPEGIKWLISEVSYVKTLEEGTSAEVTLMPAEAFTTEPTTLQAYDYQIQQALTDLGMSAPPASAAQ